MAFCGKCGTQLSDGAKFCPKCGNPSNDGKIICSMCGAEFSNKAKFCPKCGNPTESKRLKESGSEVGIIQDSNPNNNENNLQNEINSQTDVKVGGTKSITWLGYGILAIVIIGACYMFGVFDGDKSINEGDIQETEQIQESTFSSPSNNAQDDTEKQNEAEFQQKIMEYENQVQQIMTQMNNILNGYVQARSYGPVNESTAVNAFANIGDLHTKGARIFDKMIDLARKYKYNDAIQMLKQEKKDFDEANMRMQKIIHDDLYNFE